MKTFTRIFLTILIVLIMTFFSVTVSFAEYSKEQNTGKRGEICTSLSGTGAENYYTGRYTAETLKSLTGEELYDSLARLMTDTHVNITNYDNCRDYADETASQNGDGTVLTLYTSYAASVDEYNGGTGWNREHVWPKSLGGFKTEGAGADLHHIRPTENSTNSKRGNKRYGEVGNGTVAKGNISGLPGGEYNGTFYEPNDEAKGDVARICLYVYVRWGAEYSKCANILNVFESVDTLLNWCLIDPPDTWEMGRNEVVQNIQGNRNVFIDYPELAWSLFDREVPEELVSPSENATTSPDTPPCVHAETVIKNEKIATCIEKGYTGDTYCKDCNKLLQKGEDVSSGSHRFDEGYTVTEPTTSSVGYFKKVCLDCEEIQLNVIPKLEKESPESYTYLYVMGAAVLISFISLGCVIIERRKQK